MKRNKLKMNDLNKWMLIISIVFLVLIALIYVIDAFEKSVVKNNDIDKKDDVNKRSCVEKNELDKRNDNTDKDRNKSKKGNDSKFCEIIKFCEIAKFIALILYVFALIFLAIILGIEIYTIDDYSVALWVFVIDIIIHFVFITHFSKQGSQLRKDNDVLTININCENKKASSN